MFISFIMEDLQKEQLVAGFVCFFMCTYLYTDSGPHTEQKHSIASGFLPPSAVCHPAQKQILPQFSTLLCPFFSSLFFPLCPVCLILSHGRSQTSHKHTNKPKIGLLHCYYLHFYIFLSTFHTNLGFIDPPNKHFLCFSWTENPKYWPNLQYTHLQWLVRDHKAHSHTHTWNWHFTVKPEKKKKSRRRWEGNRAM